MTSLPKWIAEAPPRSRTADEEREKQIDFLARALRDARCNRAAGPMTDQEWARAKRMSGLSYRILRAEAIEMIDSGDLDA